MKLQKKLWALGTVVALAAALFAILMPSANATSNPPWEPDPQAVGTITFYNSAGQVVTSGSDLSNVFAYAAANSPTARTGTTKAYVSYAFPNHSGTTATWFVTSSLGYTPYPITSAPAPVNGLTNPVANVALVGANNLNPILGQGTNDPTTGYNHVLQVRLGDTGGTWTPDSSTYWDADILIDPTAGTWQQIYPAVAAGPTATTTTLTASPASPQPTGSSTIAFTATVSPSAAAGSVQFSVDGTPTGSAVTVTSGKAVFDTTGTALGAGSHNITATFTPTDSSAYSASTATALPYTITSPATTTTTTLSANPPAPITSGTHTTLTATVTPDTAVGSVQFFDGSTSLGSANVSDGTANSSSLSLSIATHSLKAVFTPTNSALFTSSTSSVLSYQVNPVPATPTSTSLTIDKASPQTYGTSLTLTGTVTPDTAVGQLEFFNGSTEIGSAVSVSGGTGHVVTTTLPAGTDSLTAKFIPTNSANFGASTSDPSSFVISQAASTVSLVASPATTAVQGTSVGLTATVGPTGVGGGTVQFAYIGSSGPVDIGGPVTVSGTTAHTSTGSLPLSTTGLTATFTPTSTNYSASPASSIDYTITKPPPATTTTGLTVTPASPVAPNTLETLKATVAPSTAAGSVAFMVDGSPLGSAVTVSGGVATTTTRLAQGEHTLQAMFIPTDSTAFSTSPSSQVSYTVLPPATETATTLDITPGTSEPYGTALTYTATVSPAAAGSVAFKDGSTTIGTATVNASTGVATLASDALHAGDHSVSAVFTPTAPLYFTASTSDSRAVTITSVDTVTSLAITPPGPVTVGTTLTLKATLTPATATGTVTFDNGTTKLGTATVSHGVASLVVSSLPVGDASITASFAAAHTGDFTASTSAPVTIAVDATPKITAVFANGKSLPAGGSTTPGASLQLHASGFQPNEDVTVDVHSTTIKIGSVRTNASGSTVVTVSLPTSLALGKHTITMVGSVGSASFTFSLVAAASSSSSSSGSGGNLASTGVDVKLGLVLGMLLLLGGLALIAGSRRRHGGAHR